MKKLTFVLSFAALFVGLPSTAAFADQAGGYTNDALSSFTLTDAGSGNFDFSFSGPSDSGSGAFITALTGTPGQYLITGMSGTVDGAAITSLFAPGTFPVDFGGGDNLLFDPGVVDSGNVDPSALDLAGVSFEVAGGTDYNLYYGQFLTGDPVDVYDLLTPTPATDPDPAPAPEPESLTLLGTGTLALLGAAAMRRRQQAVAL
jgi:hypothetical protein